MYVPLTVFSLKWVMTNNDAIDFMVERAFHPQQHFYKSEQEMSLKMGKHIKVIPLCTTDHSTSASILAELDPAQPLLVSFKNQFSFLIVFSIVCITRSC